MFETKKQQMGLFVAEIPLLFETGSDKDFEQTVLVLTNPALCQKRFIHSGLGDAEEFLRRSARLINQEEKKTKATLIIYNQGTLEDLKIECKKLYYQLTSF